MRQVLKTIRVIVFLSNAPDTPVPHIDTDFLQFFGHPGAAIAAQAQARLFFDVGQNDHVCVLPAAGRTAAKGPQFARADVHHLTQPLGWKAAAFAIVARTNGATRLIPQ